MRKLISLIILIVASFCATLTSATIINVPLDYSTIQDAINNADFGDTIIVSNSTYTENLIINESVKIIGSGDSKIIGSHIIKADDVTLYNLIFEPSSSATVLTIDTSLEIIDNINISKNIFNMSYSPSVGIDVGGVTNKVIGVNINENIFYGPSDMICNPWKIGGSFGSPLNAEVFDLSFEKNEVYRCSIPINLGDEDLKNIKVNDNLFRNTDGALYIWGEAGPSGVLSNFEFTNNDLDSTNSYGIAIFGWNSGIVNTIFTDSNFGTGNKINFNDFIGIPGAYGLEAVSVLANLDSYSLDARNNFWGDCSGPGIVGPGLGSKVSVNVTFSPWLGVCIFDKVGDMCSIENKNSTVYTSLNGSDIHKVWISYDVNGTEYNKTYSNNVSNNYSFVISNSTLAGGMNVTWNVYANDSTGRIYKNGDKTFYVRSKTSLAVNEINPDGFNGWYVTEPEFTLIPDSLGILSFYQWDSDDIFTYTLPFNLENIPNQPKVTAGILELNWWTKFNSCGNETKNSKIFYVDLTKPNATDLFPENESTIYNNLKPTISAYLEEYYQSNSGINLSSAVFSLDGEIKSANVSPADTLDAILSYTPDMNLSEGLHNVTIFFSDKAGNSNSEAWYFTLNTTQLFNMSINSPVNGSIYGNRKVLFDVSLSEQIKSLEYIDWSSKNPKWKRLCKDCLEYNKTKSFNDGEHNISIRAMDYFGNVKEENISFSVDSKEPRISKTNPKKNEYTNGSNFYVRYTEENLNEVMVSWNPSQNLIACTPGPNQECRIDLNLSGFEDQEIEYWFNVSDFVRSVQSKKVKANVDTIPPVIESFNYSINGRKVNFEINATEKNFEVVNFIDYSDTNPRLRRLCTRLDEEICEKTRSFKLGGHNISIEVVDKAGNRALLENINFVIF